MPANNKLVDALMSKSPTVEVAEEADMGDGLDTAAEEVMAAFEAKDPAALRTALESFVSMCGTYPEE